MKFGGTPGGEAFDNKGNKLTTFDYWVLPDKPMTHSIRQSGSVVGAWDHDATQKQTEQIRGYLGDACKGKWMESGNRFYFELEEDWEMFKTMCMVGWQ
jgi:hypothetical protein